MPRYEMALVFRCLQRPDLVKAIKRTSEAVIERGGVLKTYENVGYRQLPYTMTNSTGKHTHGNYMIMNFDSNPNMLVSLKEKLKEEPDVLRTRILRKEEETIRPCEVGPCDFGEMNDEMRRNLRRNLRVNIKKL